MKYIFSLFATALLTFAACNTNQGYVLKGVIYGASNLQTVLEQSYFDRSSIALGKAVCDANGAFSIKSETPWKEGLYRMTIGAKKLYFILDGKENVVEIKGDLATIDKMQFEVTGSETMKCYSGIIGDMLKNTTQMNAELAKQTVGKACTPMMKAFLALQVYGSSPATFMEDLKSIGKQLAETAPDSKYTTDYNALIAQVEQQEAQQAAAELIKVGQPAPNISLPGPDGKTHSLSSLKGKVVLLDFWASWCGPCRKANPHVVEIYNKYKSKGFDVFSVSLDGADPRMKLTPEETERRKADGKAKWIAAIAQDKLTWPNHVSDLQHWGSAPAATYGVNSIPKTFLIGKDGIIIALNPGDKLEQEVLKAL